MATGKRYYWIKLKTSFMTSDAVDFLMGQPDGANYVVLYQMLCLKTINTGGKLERQIGEIIVPYDEAKIQRDCKWFSIDTIHVALNLYKKLGLIYVDNNGVLCLTGHADLIGSETDYASQKRQQRFGKETLQALPEESVDSTADSHVDEKVDSGVDIVHRDIEYRDRDIEIDINNEWIINDAVAEEENVSVIVQAAAAENPKTSVCTLVGNAWNKTGFPKVRSFPVNSPRGEAISALSAQYGTGTILAAIEKAKQSEFLNELGDRVTLDWFLQPEHFQKIIEGQYDRKWERMGKEPKKGPNGVRLSTERDETDEELDLVFGKG